MKTYKNSEVMKMLEENRKLRFKGKDCKLAVTNNDSLLIIGSSGFARRFYLEDVWELVQKPVSFMEAVNSGKRFKPDTWSHYYFLTEVLEALYGYHDDDAKTILNGKWLVEE